MGRGMASHTAWRARAHCEGEGWRRTGGRGRGGGVGNRWGREGARKTQASLGTPSTPSELGKRRVQPRSGHRWEAPGFSPAVIRRLLSGSGNAAGPGAHKRTPMLAPAPSRGAPSYRQLTWPRFPAAAPLLTPSPALPPPPPTRNWPGGHFCPCPPQGPQRAQVFLGPRHTSGLRALPPAPNPQQPPGRTNAGTPPPPPRTGGTRCRDVGEGTGPTAEGKAR